MEVFLSWSGPTSKAVAKELKAWLRLVIQSVRPWMSEDIEKGTRWSEAIAKRLGASKFGIVCVTADNIDAPWLNFEAGAISKAVEESRVWTFLHRLKPSDVTAGPLTQFQHTQEEKQEVFALLESINKNLGDGSLAPEVLTTSFDLLWPKLESALAGIKDEAAKPPQRPERELLEETLDLVRELARTKTRESMSRVTIDAVRRAVIDQVRRADAPSRTAIGPGEDIIDDGSAARAAAERDRELILQIVRNEAARRAWGFSEAAPSPTDQPDKPPEKK